MCTCNEGFALINSQTINVKEHNSNKTRHIKTPCKYHIYWFVVSNYKIRETVLCGSRGAALIKYQKWRDYYVKGGKHFVK